MPQARDFDVTFSRLREILLSFEKDLVVANDDPGNVNASSPMQYQGKELYFGGVRLGKQYVSYYLFPVYMFPELLEGASPELRKRMQGKSCFNFTKPDPELMKELEDLTRKGLESFKERDLVSTRRALASELVTNTARGKD
jgi:hypothetical protein